MFMGTFLFNQFAIAYIRWVDRCKPMVKHKGFYCGCCGRWWNESFEVPDFLSMGSWNTWGLCPEGKGCWVEI